jgi:hypothetical protein
VWRPLSVPYAGCCVVPSVAGSLLSAKYRWLGGLLNSLCAALYEHALYGHEAGAIYREGAEHA